MTPIDSIQVLMIDKRLFFFVFLFLDQEYICQRGYASPSECTNLGFCNNTPRKGVVESLLTGSALNAGAVGLTGYLLRGHH